jgi:hypothetical protein
VQTKFAEARRALWSVQDKARRTTSQHEPPFLASSTLIIGPWVPRNRRTARKHREEINVDARDARGKRSRCVKNEIYIKFVFWWTCETARARGEGGYSGKSFIRADSLKHQEDTSRRCELNFLHMAYDMVTMYNENYVELCKEGQAATKRASPSSAITCNMYSNDEGNITPRE